MPIYHTTIRQNVQGFFPLFRIFLVPSPKFFFQNAEMQKINRRRKRPYQQFQCSFAGWGSSGMQAFCKEA